MLTYLQVNLRTVYRLIDAGKLPAVRVGRQWRFRRRDIDAWLDSQRAARPPKPRRPGRSPAGRAPWWSIPTAPARELAAGALRDAGWAGGHRPGRPVALDRLQRTPYDLILTELRLPGLDAFALVREARRDRPRRAGDDRDGHSTETAAIEALNLGVAGYLVKPSRPTEIAATAARVLGG